MSQQQPPPGWGPPQPPPPGWGAPGWGAPPPPTPPPGSGAYGWGGPPPAPKPGVIPLRPLGVGDILEATLATLRRYPAAVFGSAALVVGVVTVLQVALLWPTITALASLPGPDDVVTTATLEQLVEDVPWAAVLVGSTLAFVLSFVLFTALAGLLSVVVGQAVLGRPLSFGAAWSKAGPRLPRLLGTALLVALVVAGVWVAVVLVWAVLAVAQPPGWLAALVVLASLVAAVPVSVFLGVRLSLATPAVMLESDAAGPIGPTTAVRRSWGLVAGGWWRTFGIVLLGAVIAGTLSQVIAVPVNIVVGALPLDLGVALAAGMLAAAVGQAVAIPISGVVLGLVYVDRRIRSEELAESLARAAGVTSQEPPRQHPPQ